MKTLAIYFGKKFAVSLIGDIVKAKSEKVATWAKRIRVWIYRIGLVAQYLDSLCEKLEDGQVTETEGEDAIKQAKLLAESVTSDSKDDMEKIDG